MCGTPVSTSHAGMLLAWHDTLDGADPADFLVLVTPRIAFLSWVSLKALPHAWFLFCHWD